MESPDTIHGRMREGAHLAGYSLQRSMENLRWLLEDSRFEQLSEGYPNVNEFLRGIQDAFKLLNIDPKERKQIAELVKELQPRASQRAIADLVGVSNSTIAADLGTVERNRNSVAIATKNGEKQADFVAKTTPATPADDFDLIEPVRKEHQREERRVEIEQRRKEIAESGKAAPISDRWHIYHADMETWKAPRQYDFIITDPPYPIEYLRLYDVLAYRANEWLKEGGLLIAMCGQSYLNKIYKMMSTHLTYWWTGVYLTPGGQSSQVFPRKAMPYWKPLLIYAKGEYSGKWFGDVCKSDVNDNDKDNHEWGQSVSGMTDLIGRFVEPGNYILDPFCGAGTTGLASLKLECFFDGVDSDIESVNVSKGRLANA